jgi:hypothetical protein
MLRAMEIKRALAIRLLRREDWHVARRSQDERPSALRAMRERRGARSVVPRELDRQRR